MYVCNFGSVLEERWVAHTGGLWAEFWHSSSHHCTPTGGFVLEYNDVKGLNEG